MITTNYNNTLQAVINCIKECGEHPMTADELAVKIINVMLANGYQHVDVNQMIIDINEYYRLLNQRLFDPWSPSVVYCNDTNS